MIIQTIGKTSQYRSSCSLIKQESSTSSIVCHIKVLIDSFVNSTRISDVLSQLRSILHIPKRIISKEQCFCRINRIGTIFDNKLTLTIMSQDSNRLISNPSALYLVITTVLCCIGNAFDMNSIVGVILTRNANSRPSHINI